MAIPPPPKLKVGPYRPRPADEPRTVTVEWIEANRRHLTLALIEVDYQHGLVGIVCDWPRKQASPNIDPQKETQ